MKSFARACVMLVRLVVGLPVAIAVIGIVVLAYRLDEAQINKEVRP